MLDGSKGEGNIAYINPRPFKNLSSQFLKKLTELYAITSSSILFHKSTDLKLNANFLQAKRQPNLNNSNNINLSVCSLE